MQSFEDFVSVEPENVITFYRNQYQSSATITIYRHPPCKLPIRYYLKTTHKDAFLVSSGKGQLKQGDKVKYIDILINEEYPLEQCLMDRFKLVLLIAGKEPIQKKFKVAINYKKDTSRVKEKDFNGIEVASRTTGSQSTAVSSILGHPMASMRKSILKSSKLTNYLTKGEDPEKINLKEELDQVVKVIEERRFRLQYLSQQILKNKSRKKFGCYITLFTIVGSFLMGLGFRQIAEFGIEEYLQNYGL